VIGIIEVVTSVISVVTIVIPIVKPSIISVPVRGITIIGITKAVIRIIIAIAKSIAVAKSKSHVWVAERHPE
jgi:hypothetical protein